MAGPCPQIVTVSGLPGSGTTTCSRLLAGRLGWPHVNAGELFRQLAIEAGVSLAEFGRRAEADRSIDLQLDARMVASARELGEVVLEGRLTGWMARRYGLRALMVWLTAPPPVRAERLGCRDGLPVEEALRGMAIREASEARRYRDFHGIDIGELSVYDLVVDTGERSAAETAEAVLSRLEEERR